MLRNNIIAIIITPLTAVFLVFGTISIAMYFHSRARIEFGFPPATSLQNESIIYAILSFSLAFAGFYLLAKYSVYFWSWIFSLILNIVLLFFLGILLVTPYFDFVILRIKLPEVCSILEKVNYHNSDSSRQFCNLVRNDPSF